MNIKTRLAVMNFLEFAVWGAYLTSMGNYLGKAGMGAEIAWFYAIHGIVSIFMPTIVGIVADKYVQPQRMLGICHLLAGLGMVGLFYLGMTNAQPDKTTFIAIYSLSVAFYMPLWLFLTPQHSPFLRARATIPLPTSRLFVCLVQ